MSGRVAVAILMLSCMSCSRTDEAKKPTAASPSEASAPAQPEIDTLDSQPTVAPAGPLAPDDLESEAALVVSEDPAVIAAARDAAEQSRREDEAKHKSTVVTLLNEVDPSAPFSDASIAAAEKLCKLGEKRAALEHFRRVLHDGTASQRRRALSALVGSKDTLSAADFDEAMTEQLLAALDDDDQSVAGEAITVCGIYRLPGVSPKLARIAKETGDARAHWALVYLSEIDPKQVYVERLGKLIMDDLETEGPTEDTLASASFIALTRFAASSDPRVVERARELMRRLMRSARFDSWQYADSMIEIFIPIASSDDVPVLQSLVAESSFQETKAAALAALCKLEGEPGRQRILIALEDPELKIAAAKAIQRQLANTGDEQVVGWLHRAMTEENRDDVLAEIVIALVRLGGPEATKAAKTLTARVSDPTRTRLEWILAGNEPRSILERVVAAGLISRNQFEKALQGSEPASDLEEVFLRAGLGVNLAAIKGPGEKFEALVAASKGKFRPELVTDEPTTDARLLSFSYGEKHYRLHLSAKPAEGDDEKLVDAVNRALADGNVAERFIPTRESSHRYVFADPKKLASFAAALHAP